MAYGTEQTRRADLAGPLQTEYVVQVHVGVRIERHSREVRAHQEVTARIVPKDLDPLPGVEIPYGEGL